MNLKFTAFILCLIGSSYVYSQGVSTYVLHDGTEIQYKKSDQVKGTRDLVVTLFDTGKEMTINLDQIKGYYTSRELEFYHFKENFPGSIGYIAKILSGKINTYETYSYSGNHMSAYYYAEKNDTIQLIRSSAINDGSPKQLAKFKLLIEDDSSVLAKANELKRLSIKNYTKLVKEYNANKFHHDSVASTPTTNDVEFVLYRKDKEPVNAVITLTAEDFEMTLRSRDIIKVKIKNTGLKKVCFDSAKTQCEVIETYPYFKKIHYEVEFDSESKTFSISKATNLAKAKLDVHEIEYYRKKNP